MARTKVRVQVLEPNEMHYKKGYVSSDNPLVVTVGDRAYLVTKLFPRTYRNPNTLFLTKKTALYATVMKGEPRALGYMDSFDSDLFERFLNDTLEAVYTKKLTAEDANKALMKWTGVDVEIEGLKAEPWLLRRFRSSPVTDEHFFRAITDSQRTKLMRGKRTPDILWFILGLVVGGIMVGVAMYYGGFAPG